MQLPAVWPTGVAYMLGDRVVVYEPKPTSWLGKAWWKLTKRAPRAREFKVLDLGESRHGIRSSRGECTP